MVLPGYQETGADTGVYEIIPITTSAATGGEKVVEVHGAIADLTTDSLETAFTNGDDAQPGDLLYVGNIPYRMLPGATDARLPESWGLANPPTIIVDETIEPTSSNPVRASAIAESLVAERGVTTAAIAAASDALIGGAPETGNTLKKLDDLIKEGRIQSGGEFPDSDTPGNLFVYNDPTEQQSRLFVKFVQDGVETWTGLLMPGDFGEAASPLLSAGAELPGPDTPGILYAYNPADPAQARLFVRFGDRWEGQPKAGDP